MGFRSGVLIADDDPVVRGVVSAILESSGDFEVVAAVGDAEAAVGAAERLRPDLALVDVDMPGGGPFAVRGIKAAAGETVVVGFSGLDDVLTVREMLRAGAASYVVKGVTAQELLSVLRAAVRRPETPATPPEAVRASVLVALADPHLLDALAEAVTGSDALELVGLAQTPHHALTLAGRLRPDVAVLDTSMPGGGGERTTVELRTVSPDTRVVAVTSAGDATTALGALRGGASSVVAAGEVIAAIEGAVRGETHLERGVAELVLQGLRGTRSVPPRGRFERLSDVLSLERVDVALQPIVQLSDQHPRGFEALARFPGHPNPGPDVWFAEAHRAGVGVELELLAVRSALAGLDRLPGDAFLAVNVSPDTVISGLLGREIAGAPAERLVLELTEHAPVADYGLLADHLGALRSEGVRIAVDDCGAGFASLRHVVLVGPEYLKLDNVLCRDVRDPSRAALARAMVGFAQETGSTVVAEGIECREDLEALRELGVELGQGYLIAGPAPADNLLSPVG